MADFAIVLVTNDTPSAEQSLVEIVADLGRSSALVRNFSYDEAQRIERDWRLAQGASARDADASGGQPSVADAGANAADSRRHPMTTLAQRVRQHLGDQSDKPRTANTPLPPTVSSGRLAGEALWAPSLEQQLECSSRGATYTVGVPAWELSAFLKSVGTAEGFSTALQMFPASSPALTNSSTSTSPAPNWTSLAQWLQEAPRVRMAAERIVRAHADSVIFIPVIARSTAAR